MRVAVEVKIARVDADADAQGITNPGPAAANSWLIETAIVWPVVRPENDSDTVFEYEDTASRRADIVAFSDKLKAGKVAGIGARSYLIDLLAKTPVTEIHIFDSDTFY